MFVRKHNLMQNMPNITKTKKMLGMMDLVVVIDTMPSDTAMMADVILPECTYLEREDLVVSFGRLEPSLALRNKVIEPLYESKPIQEILKGLGDELAIGLFEVSCRYDEELQEKIKEVGKLQAFEEGGYDLSELYRQTIQQRNKKLITQQYGEAVYKMLKEKGVWYPCIEEHKEIKNNRYRYYPEKKKHYCVKKEFRVKCYLEALQKEGYDPIPAWREEYDFKVEKGKFRLITGRYVTSTQTASANNMMLHEFHEQNNLWINDKIAEKLEIKLDDTLVVTSNTGKIVIKAYPTNKIAPEVVWMAHGFGMQNPELEFAYGSGASDNILIEDKFEKIYGCATMHHTDVAIRKL